MFTWNLEVSRQPCAASGAGGSGLWQVSVCVCIMSPAGESEAVGRHTWHRDLHRGKLRQSKAAAVPLAPGPGRGTRLSLVSSDSQNELAGVPSHGQVNLRHRGDPKVKWQMATHL